MPDGIALRFDSVPYSAANERLLHSVLAAPSTATRARAGVRAGGGLEVTVDSTGNGTATIAPGGGIITDTGAGAGSYPFVIPSAVDIALGSRPSVGQSRLVAIVAQILNVDERPGDGAGVREVDLYAIAGAASSGTPTPPTVPTGQLRLAELTVPSSGTISVAKPPPRISALGGVIPVANATERDAISPIYDSLIVYREDTDTFEGRTNGAWRPFTQAAATGDDALIDLTLESGWAHLNPTTEKTQIFRHAGMVTLFLSVAKASFNQGDVIAEIPAGYRPPVATARGRVRIVGQYSAATRAVSIIPSTGEIVVDNTSTGGIAATITYPAGS